MKHSIFEFIQAQISIKKSLHFSPFSNDQLHFLGLFTSKNYNST